MIWKRKQGLACGSYFIMNNREEGALSQLICLVRKNFKIKPFELSMMCFEAMASIVTLMDENV